EMARLGLAISQKKPATITKRLAAMVSIMVTSLKNTDLRMGARPSYSVKAASDEHVSSAAHSTNEDWLLGIISEFLANAADQNVNRPVVGFPIDAPGLIHNAIAGEDPAAISHKKAEQFELRGGQSEIVSFQAGRTRHPTHFQGADPQSVLV